MDDVFIEWFVWMVIYTLLALGLIVLLGTLGWLPPEPWSGLVGIALGVVCLFAAAARVR